MVLICVGIILFIIGLCISAAESDKIYSFVGLGVCLLFFFFGCFKNVPTGHTGILITFGKVEDRVLDSGIHFEAPWKKVVKMDNRVQKITVNLSCFSSDIQEVNTVYTANYQINKSCAQDLYKNIGVDYSDIIIIPTITESVKTIMAYYTAEELIGKRDTLANKIEELLADQLIKYNIELSSTSIEDIDFTDAFTNAVEAKQVASQNKLTAEIEQAKAIKQAEADAEVAKTKAQADAEVAKIQAQADLEVQKINADAAEYTGQKEAAKNKAISESLTEALINYYRIMQWDGKLPETMLGENTSVLFGE